MKTLSLSQPWATLVAIGAKRIETRSWRTDYRGTLAIHAAKTIPPAARNLLYPNEPFRGTLSRAGIRIGPVKYPHNWLPVGVVIAICELKAVKRIAVDYLKVLRGEMGHPNPEAEIAFGDYTIGRYAWILGDVRRFREPIPAKGALGLWEWMPPKNWESLLEVAIMMNPTLDGVEYHEFPGERAV